MNAAIGSQFVQRHVGDFAADGIERADDHDAGRVVDDDVNAGGFFEGPNVTTFAANDTAFHVVAGNVNRAGGRFGGMRSGVALQVGDHHLASLRLTGLLQMLFVSGNGRAEFAFQLGFQSAEQPLGGFVARHAAELMQHLALLIDNGFQFFAAFGGFVGFFG